MITCVILAAIAGFVVGVVVGVVWDPLPPQRM